MIKSILPMILLPILPLGAVQLTNITELRFDATIGEALPNGGVLFKNARAVSSQSTLNDYIEATYSQDTATGALNLTDSRILPNVGILAPANYFFVKDTPSGVTMYRTPSQPSEYGMDIVHTLSTANGPYFMDLTAGQSINFHFTYPSAPATMVVTSPSGSEIVQIPFSIAISGSNIVYTVPILETGPHRIDFVPDSGTASSLRFRFLNANRNALRVGAHGQTEAFVLSAYSREYEKVKLTLPANRTVSLNFNVLTGPISLEYCNSRGAKAGISNLGFQGGVITFNSIASDDYYLFFYPQETVPTSNISVSLTVNISPTVTFADWTSAHGVSALRDSPAADNDGDGTPNIVEYALGSKPSAPGSFPSIPFIQTGNQGRLTYTVAPYAENVTVTPQQSDTLGSWINVSPVPQGSGPDGQSFEATTSGTSTTKFMRLKVSQ